MVERFLSLYLSVTKHEARPQLVRWYEDEWSSVFDEYLYTGKDDFRLLRWVMARGIYSEVREGLKQGLAYAVKRQAARRGRRPPSSRRLFSSHLSSTPGPCDHREGTN